MALTGEAAIADALFWKLSQANLGLPIAFPGLDFTPPSGPYLQASFQPNRPPPRPIGFVEPRGAIGLLQISVRWPGGQGALKAYDVAETVKAAFPIGSEISRNGVRVRIVTDPSVAGHLTEDDNRIMVPVTIPWSVWTL
jgi:hypothetical protein